MANLLLLLDWSGNVSEPIWNCMVQRCRARAPFAGVECQGPGFRAFAAPSRASEAGPLLQRRGAGGDEVLLLDRASWDENDVRDFDWTAGLLCGNAPFAGIRIDIGTQEVEVFRDLMGQRRLVYARVPGALAIASGEHILLGHPDISSEFDLNYLAAYFSGMAPGSAETVFAGIRSVEPGESIRFSQNRSESRRRRVEPDDAWCRMSDDDVVARFRSLFQRAVATACQGGRRVGISLSAGLDSSSVAAVASRVCHHKQRPLAVTQGFNSYPAIDERELAAQCADSLNICHASFAADPLLPFTDPDLRPICPDAPQQSPYREWKETTVRLMRDGGVDIMLSGDFGDYLFAGAVEWLDDALRHRRLGIAARELIAQIRRTSLSATLQDTAVRRPVSRLLGRVQHRSPRLEWLRKPFQAVIQHRISEDLARYRDFPRPFHAARLLDGAAAIDASSEQWFTQRHGIEFRIPFRDLELTRWCLSLPADFSQRKGERKWLLRESMRGLLIEPLRQRSKSSDLTPIYIDAMHKQRAEIARLEQAAEPVRALVTDRKPDDPGGQRIASWLACSFGAWISAIRQ